MSSNDHRTRLIFCFQVFAFLAFLLPISAQQQITLTPNLSSTVLDQQEESGPEQEWNCLDVGVMEAGIRCIIPNYKSGDPAYVSQQKNTAKALWEESYFVAGGTVGSLRDGGTLAGMEFSMFEATNPVSGPSSWKATAELIGADSTGTIVHLGTLYLYELADWNTRIGDLAALMGGTPPTQYEVWRGATLHASSTGNAMRMGGVGNILHGDAYSGDQFRLGGTNWTAMGVIMHVGVYLQFGTGHQLGSNLSVATQAQLAPKELSSEYLNAATAAGQYFGGDLTILNDGNGGAMASDGTALSGVVYVAGDVLVDGSYISESLTIVADGVIDLSGSSNVFNYAVDGLLFWSLSTDLSDAIAIDGQANTLTGAIHAPSVELRVGGSNNSIEGRLASARVKITGGANVFTDGTD